MNEKKTIKSWVLSNSVFVIGILFAIVNLWIAAKLYPILSDIKTLVVRVDAQGEQFEEHKSISSDTFNRIDGSLTKMSDSLNKIDSRLSRIEGKLE